MGITFGVLAHVDHGKTTLSEHILFNAGAVKSTGKVDFGSTLLDYNEIEKERGITVFTDSATFRYKDKSFNLLDTPGHIDFAIQMERSAFALDYAVLVISAVEGIQGHTNTIWNTLKNQNLPTFIFINKIDRAGANVGAVMSEIKEKWDAEGVDFTKDFKDGAMSSFLAEKICTYDDNLMTDFFENGYDKALWIEKTVNLIKCRKIMPVFVGSAIDNNGVANLIEGLYYLTAENENAKKQPFAARVYKISHDKQGVKVTHLRITKGEIKTKQLLKTKNGQEKINEIRVYNGAKSTLIPKAFAGDIVGVTGINGLSAGDVIGEETALKSNFIPLMKVDVNIENTPLNTAMKCLRELEQEEPLLNVLYDETAKTITIHIAGKIQLEVLQSVLVSRFNINLSFGDCKVLYKETITQPVYGCGHFEPLKHYAEVHFLLEPLPRGSGIAYESCLSADILDKNWQNLIKTHVFEKQHIGVLTASPITDVKITLKNGRAHIKHTAGGDFRQATYRAIRHGLMCANSIVLEPFYLFKITADMQLTGKIISDIEKLNGSFETPLTKGQNVMISGKAPAGAMEGYVPKFISITKGEGSIFFEFCGYFECTEQQKVIENIAYDAQADLENTADSYFCPKGSGLNVNWKEAKSKMQLEILE